MKKLIFIGVISLSVLSAQAQVFRPEAVSGAVLGGVAGAIIGNNSGGLRHNGWAGAAIGAGAGLLIGNAIGESNERATQVPPPYPYVSRDYNYGYAPYGDTVYYSDSTPSYVYSRPNYAATGTVLGGIAGAIIGNNSGHRTWQGAAIGAGAGLLLGSLAEQDARSREAYAAQQSVVQIQAQPRATQRVSASAATSSDTAYNAPPSAPVTPMSNANSLFAR